MSLAGASPPPPPPPPRKGLADLPAELLLSIIEYLRTDEYAKFALALYPLLQRHGLVPPLTLDIYRRIVRALSASSVHNPTVHGLDALPIELTELILHYLEPADVIAVIFAHRRLFLRYLHMAGLSWGTQKSLWAALAKDPGPKRDGSTP